MRISRKKRKEEPKKDYRFNESISSPVVLVLGNDGGNLGEMNTGDAIRLAKEQGLDLVEINPKVTPPVVKIMDFGQYQYRQEKEDRIRRARQHVVDIKGLRLSLRIGQNDLDIRKRRTVEFLDGGDKVRVEIMLRGRENQHADLAFNLLNKFLSEVNAITPAHFETKPERQGNKIFAIILKG